MSSIRAALAAAQLGRTERPVHTLLIDHRAGRDCADGAVRRRRTGNRCQRVVAATSVTGKRDVQTVPVLRPGHLNPSPRPLLPFGEGDRGFSFPSSAWERTASKLCFEAVPWRG